MKLIVEMEMPNRCAECDIVQKTKSGYRCPIASKMHGFSCVAGRGQLERPYYCPIDGVLPEQHGDLIDRDELLETCLYFMIDSDTSAVDANNIQDAKVIIAAERKDDGTTAD